MVLIWIKIAAVNKPGVCDESLLTYVPVFFYKGKL